MTSLLSWYIHFLRLSKKLILNVLENCSALNPLTYVLPPPLLRASFMMSAPMETLTRSITGGLRRASLFNVANQDHDYYLARAAGLRCLETCFPKETTEGQLLSAELFSLLSMCVLAACPWPTDPEQQHETGPPAPLLLFFFTPSNPHCPPPPWNPPKLRHTNMHFANVWNRYIKCSFCVVCPASGKISAQEVVWM